MSNNNEPKISFHHQPDGKKSIGKRISELTETAEKIWIASAFLTKGGLDLLDSVSKKCDEINIICAMHGGASDIEALENWVNEKNGIKKVVSVYDKRMFHPKIYYFENNSESTVLIGSGNFTQNGTSENGNVETIVELKNNDIPDGIKTFLETSFNDGIKLEDFWKIYPKYNYNKNSEPKNNWPLNGDDLAEHIKGSFILSFEGDITQSFLSGEGHKTIRNELLNDLDTHFSLSSNKTLNRDINVKIKGKKIPGKLYRGIRKGTLKPYYAFSIFRNLAKHTGETYSADEIVEFLIDLKNMVVSIKSKAK